MSKVMLSSRAVATKPAASAFATRRTSVVVRAEKVNPSIDKENPKVVHSFKTSEIPKKAVFCRCWRSAKFPYCDAAHVKYNQASGDNVGPLIIDVEAAPAQQ